MDDDGAAVGVENTEFNESSGPRSSDDHHESVVEVLIANGVVERVEDIFCPRSPWPRPAWAHVLTRLVSLVTLFGPMEA